MRSLIRSMRFMRPYSWIIIIGVFTVILPVVMELLVPRLLQYIIDQGIRTGRMSVIRQGAVIMLAAALIGAVMTVAQGYCRAILSQGLAFDMRNALFSHIQSFSFANLDQMRTGQLITRVSSDVDTVRLFSSGGLALLLRTSLMVVGSIIMLVVTDWQLSIIVFVILIISVVLLSVIVRIARPLFMIVQQRLDTLNTLVQENLAGVEVVKAFVREHFENSRFAQANLDYRDENIRVGRLLAIAMPALLVLTNLGTAAVLWWGGLSVISERMTIGSLIAFNNYLMIGMAPLLFLSNLVNMIARADASAERVLEVLDTQPSIESLERRNSSRTAQGQVIFDEVSFHYDAVGRVGQEGLLDDMYKDARQTSQSENETILQNISFCAEAGQKIALLGATGSGKSSLINLIPRFYDVTGGSVKIDGIDVRDWDLATLRANIAVVLQQTTLFSGTVRDNIAYGLPDASLDDVITAAKMAQAHDFIAAMPEGYESKVEAGGANFSGGQKQRIAIARALLIKPAILIFDDSTSAVDLDTEFKIQEALNQIMQGCTTFVVAQRINSVLNADQISVLEKGPISASGSHVELMRISPIYQEIFQSQLGEQ